MIDDCKQFLRERICSVSSYGERPTFAFNYPLLRTSCESGKMFEILPQSQDIQPKHEVFEIEIRAVEEFERSLKWPDGPSVDWHEVEEIMNHVRGPVIEEVYIHITDQGFVDGDPYPAHSGISLVFETGARIAFRHSESLPMSVDVEMSVGDAPHNE